MKKILFIAIALPLMISACKTSKQAPLKQSAYQPPVQQVLEKEMPDEKVPEVDIPETPIMMKIEEVTIEKSNDQKLYAFYVIIGSFSMPENAHTLQDQQLAKGVQAIVLKSGTGMLRVACLGTDSEQEARKKIGEIRKGKELRDVWLLKSK